MARMQIGPLISAFQHQGLVKHLETPCLVKIISPLVLIPIYALHTKLVL